MRVETYLLIDMLSVKCRYLINRNWLNAVRVVKWCCLTNDLLGGWCDTCSAMNVNWSRRHHGIGPSVTSLGSLCSSGMSQWHWKISPKIGLYGFFATALFRPAWYALRYQRHTWTIRSRGSLRSAILEKDWKKTTRVIKIFNLQLAWRWFVLLQKEIRMRKIICVHFQQRAAFQDEGWQHNFREVHADLNLGQQVGHNISVRFHW